MGLRPKWRRRAFLGPQTLLLVGDGLSPENFGRIGEVIYISAIAQRRDLIDDTPMISSAKQYVSGLADGQEITVTCNFIRDWVEFAYSTSTGIWTNIRPPI